MILTNLPGLNHLDIQDSLPFAMFFKDQPKKDGSEIEPDTVSKFKKTPVLHWLTKTFNGN